MVLSEIGDKDNLKRFIEAIKLLGEVEDIRCQLSGYQGYNILSCLSDMQRDVNLEAKKNGCYGYPRRINGDRLAQKMGISKAATIEHFRKTEARIMQISSTDTNGPISGIITKIQELF